MSRSSSTPKPAVQAQRPTDTDAYNDHDDDEQAADRHTAAAAEARRALADILSRPQQSLADVLGETMHDEDDARSANDTSRDAAAEDEDAEDVAARRRALLAATMGTAESAGIGADAFDPAAAGGVDDRASLYSELHSYLDGLKARDDLDMPADFGSDMVSEQIAARAAYGSDNAAAPAAASPASSSAARPRYQFAAPFSPPSNRVIRDNHTPSPSHGRGAGANGMLESKELEPHAAARSGSSASKTRTTSAISPLSPANPKGRSSPASSHQHRPSSQSRAAAPRSPPESKQDGAAGDSGGYDPLNPDIGLEPGEEAFDPQAPFDETKEMDKIAQLDALLAEAEGRSAEMDRRLAELMSQPLPALMDEAGNSVSSGLMLMPPSPSQAQAHDAQQSDDGFFMTSVPGGVGVAPAAAESAADAEANNLAAATPAAAAPPADDPALWVFDDVEEMDAPLVVSNGEGFRPSAEDQVKLDEIDALLNHFRASDSALSSNYRPRFVHPPVRHLRKKKRAPKPVVDPTTTVAVVAPQPQLPEEEEDEEEIDDEPIMSPSDPAVAARVAAFTSALTVHSSAAAPSSSAAADGDLDSSALGEEDRAEILKLNKKLNRLAKNAAAASSAPAGSAGKTSDDALRRILAKTQASASARSNGGNVASTSKFPTFAFPKAGASGYTSVNSTDAILQSLLDDEDRSVPSLSSAADMEREIHSAMDDENELDDEEGAGGGDDDYAAAAADEDVPRDPRARMDKLQAQVDAIRARVHTETNDYVLPDSTDDSVAEPAPRKKMSAGASSSAAKSRDRVSSAGVRRANHSASYSAQHAPLTARPRSDPAGPGFDLHGVSASAAAAALRSDSPPSPSAASAAAYSSRSVTSLSDRLDEAIGIRSRPSSSAGSSAGDAWRTWKPASAASSGSPASSSFAVPSMDAADFGGSASQVRAAARSALPGSSPRGSAYGSPSPRQGVAAGRQARPLRAMSGSGSGTAMLASMQGGSTPPSSMHAQRAGRPMSASHADSSVTSFPPPISSTQAQLQASASRSKLSKTQQLPTVDGTWK